MTSSAASFGAPVTEPGGKAARSRSRVTHAVGEPALDLGDEVPDAGVRARLGERGDADAARPADPAEIVADEVDDHHVLRAVLRGGRRARRAGPRGRVPLIGALRTRAAARGRGTARATGWPARPRARRRTRRGPSAERPPPRRRGRAARRRAGRRGAGRGWPGTGRRRRSARGTPPPPRRARPATAPSTSRGVANGRAGGGAASRAASSARRRSSAAARPGVHRASNHQRPSASRRSTWS